MALLFQFSIRKLLIGVTFTAVGIAALLNANSLWEGTVWGMVLYAMVAAVLLSHYREGASRAFWLGFAAFGWTYLAVFLTSQLPAQTQNWYRTDPLRYETLITTRFAHLAYEHLLPKSRQLEQIPAAGEADAASTYSTGSAADAGDVTAMTGSADGAPPAIRSMYTQLGGSFRPAGGPFPLMVANPDYVSFDSFVQIFHALCLLLIAAAGGKICQIMYRTRPLVEQ
jgi:hypothetical protein